VGAPSYLGRRGRKPFASLTVGDQSLRLFERSIKLSDLARRQAQLAQSVRLSGPVFYPNMQSSPADDSGTNLGLRAFASHTRGHIDVWTVVADVR
jgi:hypothetical protein